MKSFILTILFVAVSTYTAPENNVGDVVQPYGFAEDVINSTIEGLRPDIPDPLQISAFQYQFPEADGSVIIGDLGISNFTLDGLQSFHVDALSFNLFGLHLNFTVSFPAIDLYLDYYLNLFIGNTIPIYGNGSVNVHLDAIQIDASATANLSSGLQLKDLLVQVGVDNATFEIHGLFNDEDLSQLLSSILNDLFTRIIDEHQDLITQILSPIIEAIINGLLANAGQQNITMETNGNNDLVF